MTKLPQQQLELLTLDAMPTKELFIEMLTRDVALIPAIVDLADNSTDGARRERVDGNWGQFWVTIVLSRSSFEIKDNCGGISVKAAREYAFRFGRPQGTPIVKGEVGRFGVGMKRGLFKLGRHFVIRSTTATSRFDLTIDVDRWAKEKYWDFKFDALPVENQTFKREDRGTSIVVTKLNQSASEHFTEGPFIENLRHELTVKLEKSIQKGLVVKVNGKVLKAHIRQLVADAALKPAKKEFTLPGAGKGKVSVELWCGLGKADIAEARKEAGWYVFCNGRMLLEADKSAQTGWGETDSGSMPAFHPQFNAFRGFAYLEADDAADLPWNTTKTLLDTDHPIYRRVRQEMIALARPVIDLLNKVKQEREARVSHGDDSPGELETMVEQAKTKPMNKLDPRPIFEVPVVKRKAKAGGPATQRIAYERPLALAAEVKKKLGVTSWREVGEETFDYYYNAECADE
jgi:hypothetical protein